MVTETIHPCENIRAVISPVEYSQIFCDVNKIIIEGSEISESLFKILSFQTSMILSSLNYPCL